MLQSQVFCQSGTAQSSKTHLLLQDEDLALAKVLQEQEQMFLRLR